MNFSGKKVVVMGLGTLGGGIGTARFFAKHEANVVVTDLKSREELTDSIDQLKDFQIEFVLGQHREEDFKNADLIIKNPSVPSSSPFITLARENNIEIEMAESLFMKLTPTKKIIGVTGTRGKSTTSQMIYEILNAAGKKVVLGGNVKGVATLELLDQIDESYFVVLELSSWMLEGFGWSKVSPWISVVTNIHPDHLNRYSGMDEYIADKKNIFKFQGAEDHVILNNDNEYTKKMAEEAKSHVHTFSDKSVPANIAISLAGGGEGGHNRYNAGAAYIACSIVGIEDSTITKALTEFHGLSGRLEFLHSPIPGVTFVNDTTSTTPIAGETAIKAFPDKNIILITGGNTKNLPTKDFIDLVKSRVKHVILFEGNVLEEFKNIPAKSGPYPLGEFEEVIKEASKIAQSGDIVLFSPGFSHLPVINEFERGDRYKAAVARLSNAKSQ